MLSKEPVIIFRADGIPQIGSGHIMRCLSIADAAREQGIENCFLTAEDFFAAIIRERGFACEVLQTDYRDMDAEQKKLSVILEKYEPESIVADSYFVTPEYLVFLSRFAEVTYIDDLASFAYPVKRVVNYNIYGPDLDYAALYSKAGVPLPQLLLGPHYAPLRRQFQNLPPRAVRQKVQDILVSTGGADAQHIALQLAQYLSGQGSLEDVQYHFVAGAMNADLPALQAIARQCAAIRVHQNVQNMARLMRQCDLAIAAAGSTLYELCACGVPTVTYAFADNQLLGMRAFEKQGVMVGAGDVRSLHIPLEVITSRVEEVSLNYKNRKRLASKMQRLVDGSGAGRIVNYIR